jgi:hypothetical protein
MYSVADRKEPLSRAENGYLGERFVVSAAVVDNPGLLWCDVVSLG